MTIKQIIQDINKKEWLFLAGISLLLIIITTGPYLYGYITAPKDTYFLGVSSINRNDYPVYFSYIEQAKLGDVLFENLYTSEDQPRIIFNLFFLVLGWLAKIFGASSMQIFQVARIVLIPIFLLVVFVFSSFLFKQKIKRKICLILVGFSSGIGVWFLPLISHLPAQKMSLDLWDPDAIPFIALYTNPLISISLILITMIFLLMLLAYKNKNLKYSIAAGLCALVLFQIHPYHFPVILLVIILFYLWQSLKDGSRNLWLVKNYIILISISLPAILYHFYLLKTHLTTILRFGEGSRIISSPPPLSFILGYGFLSLFVLVGIYSFFKNKKDKNNDLFVFLLIWLVVQIFLVYSPFPHQRKMIAGLHIVMSIFAATGIFFMYEKLKMLKIVKNPFFLIIIFIILFAFSNIYVISRDITYSSHSYFSINKNIINGMKWLKQNTSEEDIILTTYEPNTGNLIPVFAVRKVYIGHWAETAYFMSKKQEVEWFFSTNNNDWAKVNFLNKNKIDYLFFTIDDQEPDGFKPQEKKYLKSVFKNNTVNVYKILEL